MCYTSSDDSTLSVLPARSRLARSPYLLRAASRVKQGTHHPRQAFLHLLHGPRLDHTLASLLEPPCPSRVVGHLIRRDMAVAVDLDDQVRFRARAGRHERNCVARR